MSRVLVATTIAAFVMDDPDTWGSWMRNAEAMIADPENEVEFFAAVEVDGRGLLPFGPFLERLHAIGGSFWSGSLDDGRTEVTTANRLRHITAFQNLAIDAAVSGGYDWLLVHGRRL